MKNSVLADCSSQHFYLIVMFGNGQQRSSTEILMYFLHKNNIANLEPSKITKGLDIASAHLLTSFNFNLTPWKLAG